MDENRHGLALVVSAPSGAGKSTLVGKLVGEFPGFEYSVSYTTRTPRAGEVDGADYHFTDKERFKTLVDEGFFAEWAEVHGNCYGTPLEPVRWTLEKGRDMLFDIDVQGARQLKESLPQALFVFLLPPSLPVLEERLRGRGTDDESAVKTRLENARTEILQGAHFDYLIVNDDLDTAYDEFRAVYLAGRVESQRRPTLLSDILNPGGVRG